VALPAGLAHPRLFSLDLLPPGRQRLATATATAIPNALQEENQAHPASFHQDASGISQGSCRRDALVRSGVLVPSLEAGAGRPSSRRSTQVIPSKHPLRSTQFDSSVSTDPWAVLVHAICTS
jgi:hypothetical protein